METRLKILQVMPSFDPAFGGPVRSALAVNSAYSIDHEILAIGPGLAVGDWQERRTVTFADFKLPIGPQHAARVSIRMLVWLARNVKRFDVVHLHFSRGLISLPAALIVRTAGRRTILQTHGMCNPWSGPMRLVDSIVTWPLMRSASVVLTLTGDEALLLAQKTGGANFRVLHNAVLTQAGEAARRTGLNDGDFRLLFCSRLHPRKRVDLFLEILSTLCSYGFPVQGVIVGNDEGSLTGAREQAADLGLDVEFVGTLTSQDVRIAMQDCHALLHPAPNEPFGMSMVEALAEGLPVVAAESSKLASLFAAYSAVQLVPDDDVDAWATSVRKLLTDQDARISQISAGQRLVREKFSVDALSTEIKFILEGADGDSPES